MDATFRVAQTKAPACTGLSAKYSPWWVGKTLTLAAKRRSVINGADDPSYAHTRSTPSGGARSFCKRVLLHRQRELRLNGFDGQIRGISNVDLYAIFSILGGAGAKAAPRCLKI